MTDLTPPEPEVEDVAATPPKRGHRGLVIGSVAAVLAVVAAAAVYATSVLSGGGRQPDELVPKSTFAYLKIDLDPAANQKLAARSFFAKFPALKKNVSSAAADDVFDQVLSQVVVDKDLDYARDVKPWFDRRAAIATFAGPHGTETIGLLRSKNDAAARRSLSAPPAKPEDAFAFTIVKGYVVISDTQTHLDDALRLTANESLRDNERYRDDVDRLDGDQIAVGWVDVQPAFQAALPSLPFGGMLPPGLVRQIKGRLVAGVHLTGDYAEAEGLVTGVTGETAPATGDSALLSRLPSNTLVAVSAHGLGKTIGAELEQFKAPGLFDPEKFLAGFLNVTGLRLREDVLPLLSGETVVAYPTSAIPTALPFGIVTTPFDVASARTTLNRLNALLAQRPHSLVTDIRKADVYIGSDIGYVRALEKGGRLGNDARFRKAMGDVSTTAAAVYVNLEPFLKPRTDLPPATRALKAVGLVTGLRGGDTYFRVRLVV